MQNGSVQWLTLGALVALVAVMSTVGMHAQGQYAANLRVVYPGVEVRRAGTDLWLPLADESLGPIGTGDTIRTDRGGRAYVTFMDDLELLILPNTIYEITTLESVAGSRLSLSATLGGHVVQRMREGMLLEHYRLEAGELVVTLPATHSAVWSDYENSSVVTVYQGEAEITTGEYTTVVLPNHGARVTAEESDDLEFAPPLSAGRLIGELEGCIAHFETDDGFRVNIRNGSGSGYDVIDNKPSGSAIPLLGVNASGTWYRVQILNGFGWSRTVLVDSQCTQLPVLPDRNLENNLRLFGVSDLEIDLLAPFYGQPDDDWWFYRTPAP